MSELGNLLFHRYLVSKGRNQKFVVNCMEWSNNYDFLATQNSSPKTQNFLGLKTFTIGITGGSGSGKTTFIEHLRDSFSEEELCIISQDDYYHPRDVQQIDNEGVRNFDLPQSIDKKAFAKDIKKLLEGELVQRKEYTFNNEKKDPKMLIFKPAPILIVEGIFVFHYKRIRKMLDLKVFLHAKENLKVIRRIKRDRVERNYPLDDVLYRYENHVLPTFEKYILPYKEGADLVINNNTEFSGGLDVMKGFIRNRLKQQLSK